MLNTFPKSRLSGFSLIELMVSIVITMILVAFAAPNFRVWLLNSQIRNAADSIQNGMQHARAEAVKQNTLVEFSLSAKATNDETSWTVQTPLGAPIDKRLSNEGSREVIRTEVPAGATTVTFDNTGRPLVNNTDGSPQLLSVHLDVPVAAIPAAQSQDLNVTVDFSGRIKMCDPNVSDLNNPRICD
jgi:type IV fimbrial biogenesis protein FimT